MTLSNSSGRIVMFGDKPLDRISRRLNHAARRDTILDRQVEVRRP